MRVWKNLFGEEYLLKNKKTQKKYNLKNNNQSAVKWVTPLIFQNLELQWADFPAQEFVWQHEQPADTVSDSWSGPGQHSSKRIKKD